ncbi:MAG: competence/damage-inducible protein A [Myxococcota bacterium]
MSRDGAWVVTIGDELLRGEIVDTNKAFLAERLLRLDLETRRQLTVADEPEPIHEVLRSAARSARVVLVSGGLGPTRDDITTAVAARAFGRTLVQDPVELERIRGFFRSLGREMSENNAKQAEFPDGAEILPNPLGTAPGFMLEAEGALLFFTPGVPRELQRMVDEQILPRLATRLGDGGVVRSGLLRTFGLGESNLDRELGDLALDDPAVTIGFRTQFPDNLVRVVVRAPTEAEAEHKLRDLLGRIQERLGDLVLGEGERSLEEIVAEQLRARGHTLALAESCTGGLLASRLTDVPGSSEFLRLSVVAYANTAKQRELGVTAAVLEAHGAVSEAVARQMAEGIRQRAAADLAVATTGVAGPGGGTPAKPVGTLWLALADAQGSVARRYSLMRERSRNKWLASQLALDWIRRRLLGLELPEQGFPRLGRPSASPQESRR